MKFDITDIKKMRDIAFPMVFFYGKGQVKSFSLEIFGKLTKAETYTFNISSRRGLQNVEFEMCVFFPISLT